MHVFLARQTEVSLCVLHQVNHTLSTSVDQQEDEAVTPHDCGVRFKEI
jgi:hypothetical protein